MTAYYIMPLPLTSIDLVSC